MPLRTMTLVASAFALAFPLPATAAPMRFPAATSLTDTAIPIAVESDGAVPLDGADVIVAAGVDRETVRTNGVAALVAQSILETPVSANGATLPLREAIAGMGASIDADVSPTATRFTIEAPSRQLAAAIDALATALGAPDFSAATLANARATIARRQRESADNPLAVALDMVRHALYAGMAGAPANGSSAIVSRLGPADALAFYRRAYVRAGVRGTIAGTADADATAALARLGQRFPAATSAAVPVVLRKFGKDPLRIVTRRDIGAPLIALGFHAPSAGDPDFATMLVIQTILDSGLEPAAATASPLPPAVGAVYDYNVTPASLTLYVNGARVDPRLQLVGTLRLTQMLSGTLLTDKSIAKFVAIARGSFVREAERSADRSTLIGTLAPLGADPLNAVLDEFDRVTPAGVRRVAKRYLSASVIAEVLPRSG